MIETGPHWQLRRNAFKHAFSLSTLRFFQDTIKVLTSQLVDILIKKSANEQAIKMDVLFGRLTIDVICKVGFDLDIHALEDSALFQVDFCIFLFLICCGIFCSMVLC